MPAPRGHRPSSPRAGRRVLPRRARSRSSSSRRVPTRRRALLPPEHVALPRPRLPPWPRGARAAPAPGRPPRRCPSPSPARSSSRASRRLIGCPSRRMRNSSAEECGRDPEAVRRQLSQRRIGVRERLLDTVHHHVRAQRRDPRLDRGAAVRERDPRGRTVREREPALGLLGPPRQRTPPGSVDGERGVLRELVVTEPPEPLLHCLQTAVVVERRAEGSRPGRRPRPSRLQLVRSGQPPRPGRWRRTTPSRAG